MFPLLSLPIDLFYPIIEAVEDRRDLISVAQTCKRLQPLAEAQLFRSILVDQGSRVEKLAEKLAENLQAQPQRYNYVRSIVLTPTSLAWQGMGMMPDLIRRMNNLRHLEVGPNFKHNCYDAWWVVDHIAKYMSLFAEANTGDDDTRPLKNIRSCKCYLNSYAEPPELTI
jgi:hypothetical protein